MTMAIKDSDGNDVGLQNLTTNSGDITVDGTNVVQDEWGNLYTDTGVIAMTVTDAASNVVHVFTTQQPGQNWEPDFWTSTVTN